MLMKTFSNDIIIMFVLIAIEPVPVDSYQNVHQVYSLLKFYITSLVFYRIDCYILKRLPYHHYVILLTFT